jgi:hypothetical protein
MRGDNQVAIATALNDSEAESPEFVRRQAGQQLPSNVERVVALATLSTLTDETFRMR